MASNKTLWSNESRTKHFLIPNEEDLPLGDYALRTLTGRQQMVDSDFVKKFEISHEYAREWVKSELTDVFGELKTGLTKSLGQWARQRSEDPASSLKRTKKQTTTSYDSLGLELFSALSGESVDSLKGDAAVLGRALRKVVSEIGDIFINALDSDKDKQVDADLQLQSFLNMMRQHGIPVSKQFENIPEKLRQNYSTSESSVQDKQAAIDKLDLLAIQIEKTGSDIAHRLRDMSDAIRQQADNSQKKKDH